MNRLYLYYCLPKTRVLGPYERFALWVQGCQRNCPGCMSPGAQTLKGGKEVRVEDMSQYILSFQNIEGITISGGEPFLQANNLFKLIKSIREKKNLGVIVYTGYTMEELYKTYINSQQAGIQNFLGCIDILIDGPYNSELNDGRALRGSSNQKVYCLTPRYKYQIGHLYGKSQRKTEIHLLNDNAFLAGIPGKEVLQMWTDKLVK